MDFSALIANNTKVINRSYSDAVSGQNVNYNNNPRPHYLTETYVGAWNQEQTLNIQSEYDSKRNAVGHVAEQLDRARIAREEAARTQAYNNRNKK